MYAASIQHTDFSYLSSISSSALNNYQYCCHDSYFIGLSVAYLLQLPHPRLQLDNLSLQLRDIWSLAFMTPGRLDLPLQLLLDVGKLSDQFLVLPL